MDIIKFIENKKKEHTYFKSNKTLKKTIYWLEEDDLKEIKQQLMLGGVTNSLEQKVEDMQHEINRLKEFTGLDQL